MLTPLSPGQWDRPKATHLLNRAGFGGPPEEIDALAQNGMAYAIRRIVDGPATPAPANPPPWAQSRDLVALKEKLRSTMMEAPVGGDAAKLARKDLVKDERKVQDENVADLGEWWLQRMLAASDPLEEKLTLFWHGHFATSAQKVHDGYLMWRQNQTLREHSRGNFGVLTKAISRDPAMIYWLDLEQSKAQHANENFARELMELFTLGEGNYTEKDVTESARAFTGYRIDPRDQSFVFQPRQHDSFPKQFLGRSGSFSGDDVIDIILQQPACAQFIAKKLWAFFASDNPSPVLVEALAATLRNNRYELRPVLHTMFSSAEFYAPDVIRTQIKSPVQWMVQTARELHGEIPPTFQALAALRSMGQLPFVPPSVKGWDGGKAWISTSTLLFRYNFAQAMLRGPTVNPANVQASRAVVRDKGNQQERVDAVLNVAMGGGAESIPVPPPSAGAPFGAGVNGIAVVPLPDYATKAPAVTTPPSRVDLAKLVLETMRHDPDALIASLSGRLFHATPPARDLNAFKDYLKATPGARVNDQTLFGLLHLMMSTPTFQLC